MTRIHPIIWISTSDNSLTETAGKEMGALIAFINSSSM